MRSGCAAALSLLATCLWPPGAAPALALDLSREDVSGFIAEMQQRHGLERAWLQQLLGDAVDQPRIIELISRPAERVRPWHEYRAHFLTEQRIAEGVQFWHTHGARLAAIERDTGVDAATIVAIIGIETFYGRITGGFRVLDALTTLAFDYPPRGPYFRGELEQFLLLVREERVEALTVKGSYAGAMGAPQFMPSSYRAYAADGDADGRRDRWGSWDDVIASVANYLAVHGWRAGEPATAPAELWYADVEGLVAGGLQTDQTVQSLHDKGLLFESELAADAPAVFIGVAGSSGPELRAGFHNFAVITRYNRSVLYALAVDDLGRSIAARLPPLASP